MVILNWNDLRFSVCINWAYTLLSAEEGLTCIPNANAPLL